MRIEPGTAKEMRYKPQRLAGRERRKEPASRPDDDRRAIVIRIHWVSSWQSNDRRPNYWQSGQ
jgi:hypothetical protein